MAGQQVPSIGRIVHYVSYGTPGGEHHSECRAAIVTELAHDDESSDVVGLAVLTPSGSFFNRAAQDENGHEGGTWHWPERTP
jgi:hypothetical protein